MPIKNPSTIQDPWRFLIILCLDVKKEAEVENTNEINDLIPTSGHLIKCVLYLARGLHSYYEPEIE